MRPGSLVDRLASAWKMLLQFFERPLRPLLPPQASEHARSVDFLYGALTWFTLLLSLGIALSIFWFAFKYRRGSHADRSGASQGHVFLEISWTVIPIFISGCIFYAGARLYMPVFDAPPGAETIYVVGKQWMWKAQHPQGPREIDEVHVPLGRPVRLLLTSQDVIHSFYVPALRLKRDALPGRYTSFWFQATQAGEFPLYCAEFCGTNHSMMGGRILVVTPGEYEAWLNRQGSGETPALAGERTFQRLGCSGCHAGSGSVRAPSLAGLFGKPVPLQGGGFAFADEAYLRESIFFPMKKVVAGFDPVMPTFAGQIREEEVLDLIEYIRSLNETAPGGKPQ
jgi:cytochrome c oxidase subunit 2